MAIYLSKDNFTCSKEKIMLSYYLLRLADLDLHCFQLSTVQPLYNPMFGVHRNGLWYNWVIKGQFYKGIIGKLPFYGHFPTIPW